MDTKFAELDNIRPGSIYGIKRHDDCTEVDWFTETGFLGFVALVFVLVAAGFYWWLS